MSVISVATTYDSASYTLASTASLAVEGGRRSRPAGIACSGPPYSGHAADFHDVRWRARTSSGPASPDRLIAPAGRRVWPWRSHCEKSLSRDAGRNPGSEQEALKMDEIAFLDATAQAELDPPEGSCHPIELVSRRHRADRRAQTRLSQRGHSPAVSNRPGKTLPGLP